MFLAAVTLATQIAGTWLISPAQSPADVQLELRYEAPQRGHDGSNNSNSSDSVSLAALGLRRTDVDAPTHATQFALNRDAGSIAFTGAIGDGVGAGHFVFSPSAAYSATIERLGISQPSSAAQLGAVLLDVSLSYVTAMAGAGVQGDFNDFLACRAVGVTPAYARALLAQFPTMKTHELIAYSALHITPEYVASLREAGASDLTPRTLIPLRALHVDGAFVRSLASVGYAHLDAHDLVTLKALHIDAAFVRYVEHRGYAHPSVDELTRLKVLNQ